MQFKAANYDDIEILVKSRIEVLREVFKVPPDKDLSHLERASRLYYEQTLSNKEHIACLVFDGALFVGCGGLCLQKEMPSPDNETGKCGYLMNIYVRKGFRRNQIGKRIVHWLIERGKEQGISKITLEASIEGMPLYESLGFEISNNYMQADI